MVNKNKTIEEIVDNAFNNLESSVKDISRKVDHANMKLDHLIETYGKDRYAPAWNCSYDLANEYRYD